MTAVDSEIDNFIRQQKAKLANERQNLNVLEPSNYYRGNARRRWGPPVDLDSLKTTEKENYRRTWYELKGKYLEPSSNRKQKEYTMKLSPRGVLDTNALILDVQKEKEREEYQERWKQHHGRQDLSSRSPINQRVGGRDTVPSDPRTGTEFIVQSPQRHKEREDYKQLWQQHHPEGRGYRPAENIGINKDALDIDQIIQEVQKEKMEEEEFLGTRNTVFVGEPSVTVPGKGVNTGGVERKKDIDTGAYRRLWEQQNAKDGPTFDDSQKNIENKISEANQAADGYRKRWESQRNKGSEKQQSRFDNNSFLIDEGRRVEKMRQLREERKKEYNEYLAKQRGYKELPLREQTDEYKVSTLGPNESDAVKLQKMKERNEEYNKFLLAKYEKDINRFTDKKPSEDNSIYATIPGLRYSTSAQKRELAAERNKEYNEMLLQKTQNRPRRGVDAPGLKQGWSTPTYEEVLDQKRAQESNYRRTNDTVYETNLHAQELSRLKDIDQDLKNYQDATTRGPPREFGSTRRHGIGQNTPNFDSPEEKQKRKEEYKRDLQQQIAEAAFARRREKDEGLPVSNTGNVNPETVHVIYGGRETSRKNPAVEAYHTKILDSLQKLDEINPRPHTLLSRRQPTDELRNFGGHSLNLNLNSNSIQPMQMDKQGGSILDLGFGPVLEPVRVTSLDPPPGLQYQPTTYVTATALPKGTNSVDEAYNFYASHNPLDPYLSDGRGGTELGGDVPVPSLDLSRVGKDGGPQSRVHFRDASRPQEAPAVGMTFASNEERQQNQRQQQSAYREELERQMLEKNIKKLKDKEAQERYEKKMEEEAKNYDPFGKGGGGAPMRDQYGNVITDLRQMRHDNVNRDNKFTPRNYDRGSVGHAGNTTRAAAGYGDDLIGPPPAQTTADGEASFARGGHGIFGMPKTDAEKMQADKYKIELKRQMEEKKADEYRKKQLEKLEEERQQKILDDQREKMQKEYEEEQRRIREKEEEARRRNEEMIRVADEKKREIERRKREADDLRQQEQREEREREMRERQRNDEEQTRGKSPVIPTLRGKHNEKQDIIKMAQSPPVPAARTKTTLEPLPFAQEYVPRTQSADVLNQLAHMRAQLQNERRRVQTMLNDQEDDVEIYDPRTAQRPPPVPVAQTKPELNVFETAMNRNAVAVRRQTAEKANPQVAEDFSALKHKNDTDSRRQFRQMFPEEPVTDEALEAQQAALLRQQEERLLNIRNRKTYDDTPPIHLNRDTHSSSSQLHSKSAFVDLNGLGHFPDDFEDIVHRNDSARSKRRTRVPSSPMITSPTSGSAFGSQTSLNVDKLARKNEDRLKRLRDMQGDDLSLYEPEDVLERFMSKQGHNRPPSGNTLLDDTWMRTGHKHTK